MVPSVQKPLKIMSASAGSGKTYNLVRTYLKLILGDHSEGLHFVHVLAMTFTNKAAAEMKSRIIGALNDLANGGEAARSYRQEIAQFLGLNEGDLTKRSRYALKQILHQYENFNVLTIDKFNLRLIRSFSRDLNMNSDFQTTTNEKDVLSEIVDQLFDEINQDHARSLTEIALKYSKENSEEELRWDFKSDLKSLAEVLTREQNAHLIEELRKQDFSLARYANLRTQLTDLKKEVQQRSQTLYQFISRFDSASFPGGATTMKTFNRLLEEDVLDTTYEAFFTPSLLTKFEVDGKTKSFDPELKQACLSFSHYFQERYENYHALRAFRSNFFNIAILQLIAKALEEYKKSDNIVLISEFNKLISELLRQEEAAFIYERIGNRYKYFLLDEFQDTSHLQWINLLPLIHDSLAHGHENLIVGDPKQSIYRFKNGLAEQFVALPGIYNPNQEPDLAQKSAYFEAAGEKIALQDNWRSKQEIVSFNNLFFEHFKQDVPELMQAFYKDIEQNAQRTTGGYVQLESILLGDEEEPEGEWPYLIEWIESCLQDGYDPGDICVLGFRSKDCNAWAAYLTKNGYKVVSADSLLLGSDTQVQLFISYLKWRLNPVGQLEALQFCEKYFVSKKKNALKEMQQFWQTEKSATYTRNFFDSSAFLRQEFGTEAAFFYHYENTYQLFQQFCRLLKMDELVNPYLHQLGDYLFQFDLNVGPDLSLLLEQFERDGKKTSVQIPENREAIKIMTGHKSKGLEFPVVLVPSMSWNILNTHAKFLLQQGEHFYYTGLSKNAKIPCVREAYEQEYSQAFLDKINLNYVIFTRAEDRLYVRNTRSKKNSEIAYQNRIHDLIQTLPGSEESEPDFWSFTLGERLPTQRKQALATNEWTPHLVSDCLWFPEISFQDRELLTDNQLSGAQRFGNQVHLLLAEMNDLGDFETVFAELLLKGQVELSLKEQCLTALTQVFNLPFYKNLFVGAKQILREQSIVVGEDETKRPDLIVLKDKETFVLDYKTGMKNPKHLVQLKQYVKLLREMGYQGLKAYVFYVGSLEVEELTSE